MNKRFIEESFPIKEVGEESAREKSVRQGHISTLHIWWARRPLASSRATAYAALTPTSKNIEEWNKKRNFIIKLCKWNNSTDQKIFEKCQKEIFATNNGEPPRILDPFTGGGAIPLEALRLGCETHAIDYNPIAVLIEKCTLEYPQKFGSKLIPDLKTWGDWVLNESAQEIGQFYPSTKGEKKGYFEDTVEELKPFGYLWARTISCENPSCHAEIPLFGQFWLAKKSSKKIALFPYIKNKEVRFKIVGDGYGKMPKDFNPQKGTVSRAIAECLVCGSIVDADNLRKQFHEGKSSERLIVIISRRESDQAKQYRIAIPDDLEIYNQAESYLQEKRKTLIKKWGIDPVPDEEIEPNSIKPRTLWIYGKKTWGEMFNSRQQLALITFADNIRKVYDHILEKTNDDEYAKAVTSYLGLAFSRLSTRSSSFCVWHRGSEGVEKIFGIQAFPMQWEYAESNIFQEGTVSGFSRNIDPTITKALEHLQFVKNQNIKITQGSATKLPYEDNFFDAVLTDPPYYDNVQYSELSDFFYVWLKRILGFLHPELFSTPLTPKTKEIVANNARHGGAEKAKIHFEEMLSKSFKEIYRVLKPHGISVIVYAHKTTKGWETIINSLLNSGLVVTASWPINTELRSRLVARGTAALASSIYIVARKIEKKETVFFSDVKKELDEYLGKKLERLWQEGISGGDFFIAVIGAGLEIFGQYETVIDYEGTTIQGSKLLEEIRKISTNYVVKQILSTGITAQISPLTRFYVLWRWNYLSANIHFDEAKKLSQSIGLNLEEEWNKGFIEKQGSNISVLGPKERDMKKLKKSSELIDVLHKVLLLWEKGEKELILETLDESGYGTSKTFFRVAQAISQSLPTQNKEKKLLDGFLSGKEKLTVQIKSRKEHEALDKFLES